MGASYPAAITAAIKDSGALLLLLTDAANASPHVLREVELAFTARRPLLPVCIGGIKPSPDLQYFLSTSQWLDTGRTFDLDDLAKIEPVLRDLVEHGRSGGAGSGPWTRWRPAAAAIVLTVVVAAAALIWSIWFRSEPLSTQETASNSSGTSALPVTPEPLPPATGAPAATPAAAPAPDGRPTTKVNPRDGQSYVWIAPGRFVMGCSPGDPACADDEKPAHVVVIARGYWLGRTEVTAAQFLKTGSEQRSKPSTDEAAGMPITGVDWSEAKAYCTRVGGRLPTEAEWEYAARAGETTRYYGELTAIAWFADNSGERPRPVGTRTPNAFGLYDMLGNVSEWVLDRYYNAYDDTSDPQAPDQPLAGNASAVARGGSWISDATGARVSRRLELPPDASEPHVGLRCALDRIP